MRERPRGKLRLTGLRGVSLVRVVSAAQDHSSSFIHLTTAVTCLSTHDGPSDGVFTAVTSQIAASSLELRALPLGNRKLADEQARELGYLGYTGLFDVRPRSSSGSASECSRIGLQKALFEPYTVKSMISR